MFSLFSPLTKLLVVAVGVPLVAAGIGAAVDAFNDDRMAVEVHRGQGLMSDLRFAQDADVANVYRTHRSRMTPATRAQYEAALGFVGRRR